MWTTLGEKTQALDGFSDFLVVEKALLPGVVALEGLHDLPLQLVPENPERLVAHFGLVAELRLQSGLGLGLGLGLVSHCGLVSEIRLPPTRGVHGV